MTDRRHDLPRVIGFPDSLAGKVAAAAASALAAVENEFPAAGLTICADDRAGECPPWFGARDPAAAGGGGLVLYCSQDVFLRTAASRPDSGLAPMVWEHGAAPFAPPPPSAQDFSPASAARFLHHHLLFAADLLSGGLDPALIPAALQEGFQEAWAVTVDGRLEARGLPGYPLALRRGMFSRTFAAAGVLLPAHWEIFRSLWEGGLRTQDDVLGAVQRLPGL